MVTVLAADPALEQNVKKRTFFGDVWRTIRTNRPAMFGFALVVLWLILGVLAPVLPIADPNVQDLSLRLQSPSAEHPLGTDDLGRDILSRLIYGARVSVPAGILVVAIAVVVGSILGFAAG
ncbi:MAG: hypothetical protein ACKOCK_07730 [Chloroflexota bacterium]